MAMTKTLSSTNSLEIYCQCLCMAIFDLLYEDIRYYYRHIEEDKLDNYCFFLTLQILRNVFEEIKQRISERKSSKLINAVGEINCAFHKSNKLGDGTYYRRKLAISLSFASLNSLKNLTKSKENEIKKSKSVHEFTIGEKIETKKQRRYSSEITYGIMDEEQIETDLSLNISNSDRDDEEIIKKFADKIWQNIIKLALIQFANGSYERKDNQEIDTSDSFDDSEYDHEYYMLLSENYTPIQTIGQEALEDIFKKSANESKNHSKHSSPISGIDERYSPETSVQGQILLEQSQLQIQIPHQILQQEIRASDDFNPKELECMKYIRQSANQYPHEKMKYENIYDAIKRWIETEQGKIIERHRDKAHSNSTFEANEQYSPKTYVHEEISLEQPMFQNLQEEMKAYDSLSDIEEENDYKKSVEHSSVEEIECKISREPDLCKEMSKYGFDYSLNSNSTEYISEISIPYPELSPSNKKKVSNTIGEYKWAEGESLREIQQLKLPETLPNLQSSRKVESTSYEELMQRIFTTTKDKESLRDLIRDHQCNERVTYSKDKKTKIDQIQDRQQLNAASTKEGGLPQTYPIQKQPSPTSALMEQSPTKLKSFQSVQQIPQKENKKTQKQQKNKNLDDKNKIEKTAQKIARELRNFKEINRYKENSTYTSAKRCLIVQDTIKQEDIPAKQSWFPKPRQKKHDHLIQEEIEYITKSLEQSQFKTKQVNKAEKIDDIKRLKMFETVIDHHEDEKNCNSKTESDEQNSRDSRVQQRSTIPEKRINAIHSQEDNQHIKCASKNAKHEKKYHAKRSSGPEHGIITDEGEEVEQSEATSGADDICSP
ncbi:unnamed protein product, partial [Dracunculus medinensis]|uniref:Uncharacterized protein n=1 Tax=Dracunculus medinensis TaxID=318479 RepID=A0A0N4U4V5_DRAME